MNARWIALAVLTAGRVSMAFQFQSLASVAPILVRDLGLGFADVGFLVGLYMLPGVVLAVPGGWLGERFGDKRVVTFGLGLMVLGDVVAGFIPGYGALLAGRLIAGTGGVLLNVLMTKMVTDWFAGRGLVLAITIYVNSFPIGMGIGLWWLGELGERAGWQAALHVTAAAALAALVLMMLAYRPHPNDRKPRTGGEAARRISLREVALVSFPGAICGMVNGAYTIAVAFSPVLMIAAGWDIGTAGRVLSAMTWLNLASTQAGGIIAHHWSRWNVLMVIGIGGWGITLLLVPAIDPVLPLLAGGTLIGIAFGVVMALPAEVLRPESRGVGMGVFFALNYMGQ
ncbi:MAG TPA: MFS transporter, partial [Sphingomonas sp.]|nr:MFS transporter [Sphingomonas sp.]